MVSVGGSKALLALSNFLLLTCGMSLLTGGVFVLLDPGRVLLSRLLNQGPLTTLPHPLLYYLAIGCALVGLAITSIGVLGCWASCIYNYCTLTIYFVVILLLLIGECAIYAIAWIWPQCLGLGVASSELIKLMQRNYGTAGQEQFTAAIDLVQTSFTCCGVLSSIEYDTSLWRLQALGPSLAVPLTCCKLDNFQHPSSYLDPHPVNASLCQALESTRQQGYRHEGGCGDSLEQWFKQQYIVFLGLGLLVVLLEFGVLLATILACTKLYQGRHSMRAKDESNGQDVEEDRTELRVYPMISNDNVYVGTRQTRMPFSFNNHAYTLSNSFRQNYRLAGK